MNTRSLTGLSLIVGPILTVLCWIIFYGTTSWNPTESTANIANMGAEADMARILLTLATVGTLLSVIGVAGLKRIMSDGAGNHFALAGLLVFTLGVAIGTGESALILGSADAFNAGEGAAAESLYFASQAIGSMGWTDGEGGGLRAGTESSKAGVARLLCSKNCQKTSYKGLL